ncbi:sulfatase-like hydrolase/transferase [Myxococcota bacterium]|nr:sulfatase-like hydrolase/transferase [Myxococcota bacterium]
MSRLAALIEALGLAAALGLGLGAVDTWATDDRGWAALAALATMNGLLLTVAATPFAVLFALLNRRSRPRWALGLTALALLGGLTAWGVMRGLDEGKAALLSQPLPRLRGDGAAPGPVVLITLDTTRGDALSQMPALSAWGAQGLRHLQASANAPWTLPSMASAMTGLPPHRHGAGARRHDAEHAPRVGLRDELPTLADALHDRGYISVAVITNPYLAPRYGLTARFDRVFDLSQEESWARAARRSSLARRLVDRRPADATAAVGRALEVLDRVEGGRFFLWLHLIDPHAPYGRRGEDESCALPSCWDDWRAARRAKAPPDPSTLATIRGLYDGELAALDAALAPLLARLAERSPDALVIVAADHGEAFAEDGVMEHGEGFTEAELAVPLLLRAPGLHPTTSARGVCLSGLYDATLAWTDGEGLGPWAAEGPDTPCPASSLLRGEEGAACTLGPARLSRFGEVERLWVDPLSSPAEPEVTLAALRACLPPPMPIGDVTAPSDEAALRALGYVD